MINSLNKTACLLFLLATGLVSKVVFSKESNTHAGTIMLKVVEPTKGFLNNQPYTTISFAGNGRVNGDSNWQPLGRLWPKAATKIRKKIDSERHSYIRAASRSVAVSAFFGSSLYLYTRGVVPSKSTEVTVSACGSRLSMNTPGIVPSKSTESVNGKKESVCGDSYCSINPFRIADDIVDSTISWAWGSEYPDHGHGSQELVEAKVITGTTIAAWLVARLALSSVELALQRMGLVEESTKRTSITNVILDFVEKENKEPGPILLIPITLDEYREVINLFYFLPTDD